MTIQWMTAFIDVPDEAFSETVEFWRSATQSSLSTFRGDGEQFVTLLPSTGDPHLRVQRLKEGPARVHLDLHVADPGAEAERATELGAKVVADHGHIIMESPSGFVFCFVDHNGEGQAAPPVDAATTPHSANQLSIDVPADRFETECGFWQQLTGWPLQTWELDEYISLAQPGGMKLRLLLQRLGTDDPDTTARGHLDVSAGEHRAEIANRHMTVGAIQTGSGVQWTVLSDPAGLPYCVTDSSA